ncbi:S8 family serine peptidase, partial [Escherichia coli]|uniref:S8 family serine peptidase n=1 Tax=Escherichia coli TaxID=562 RepID=UPI0028DFAC4B
AAPGAELVVAQSGAAGYAVARGTSFAAPLVAGLLAEQLSAPDPAAAREAVVRLAQQAADLGARGRDEVFGWGLVGEQARNR